jgi:hypothetical protein
VEVILKVRRSTLDLTPLERCKPSGEFGKLRRLPCIFSLVTKKLITLDWQKLLTSGFNFIVSNYRFFVGNIFEKKSLVLNNSE